MRGKVFVVDDDAGFLAAVLRVLRASGYEAHGVSTLAEFKNLLPLPASSCVLADLYLNGECGMDIPAILLAEKQAVPIVFMSATDDTELVSAANAASKVRYLRKPFEAKDLIDRLNQAMVSAYGAN